VICLAPRAREDSVRPHRLAGASVRPLNVTVRRSLMLRIATGTSVPYDARPGSPGFDTEVSHATQETAPRSQPLSRSLANDGRDSLPRPESNAGRASLAATKSSARSSVAMTHAPASLGGDFKNCCMLSGEFDGSDRHHFFQRVTTPSNNRWRGP
jgi:hypothetical protein